MKNLLGALFFVIIPWFIIAVGVTIYEIITKKYVSQRKVQDTSPTSDKRGKNTR